MASTSGWVIRIRPLALVRLLVYGIWNGERLCSSNSRDLDRVLSVPITAFSFEVTKMEQCPTMTWVRARKPGGLRSRAHFATSTLPHEAVRWCVGILEFRRWISATPNQANYAGFCNAHSP